MFKKKTAGKRVVFMHQRQRFSGIITLTMQMCLRNMPKAGFCTLLSSSGTIENLLRSGLHTAVTCSLGDCHVQHCYYQ